jgi:hypothetical protein
VLWICAVFIFRIGSNCTVDFISSLVRIHSLRIFSDIFICRDNGRKRRG